MMRRTVLILVAVIGITAAGLATADEQSLLTAYVQYCTVKTTAKQWEETAAELSAVDAAQVKTAMTAWQQRQLARMKPSLSAEYGDNAPKMLSSFIAGYTEAEAGNDQTYLASLSSKVCPDQKIATYAELRSWVVDKNLSDLVAECSDVLAKVETWTVVAGSGALVPPLHVWLADARNDVVTEDETNTAVDRLRTSEGTTRVDLEQLPEAGDGSALDKFQANRDEQNKAKMERAQKGMRQLAEERREYEAAYASKVKSAAAKDAKAMEQHAQALAATQEQAIEQRKYTWQGRLKRLVGTVVGAAGNVFAGAIGGRAGQEVVDAIF